LRNRLIFSSIISWPRPAIFAGFCAVSLCLGLTGCYEPLYTASAGDASTSQTNAGLEDIKVAIIPNREGQILHNLLLDRLNPTGRSADPKYQLNTTLSQGTKQLGYTRRYEATRANLTLVAEFTLTEIATGKVVYKGRSRAVGSYNINTSNYQTDASADDARRRASREVADDMKLRIAAALGRLHDTEAVPPEPKLQAVPR